MRITERPLTYEQYTSDRRFRPKVPNLREKEVRYRCGDNIYQPIGGGRFEQLPNPSHGESEIEHDLGGRYVLISDHFLYFGRGSIEVPDHLRMLICARGHKSRFSGETIHQFLEFIHKYRLGIHAPPAQWPDHDSSWREAGKDK